ncbi:hypothetical protein GCM10022242_20020 [Nocardioides panacisoli]|uniref:Uncharacterized protein n=1 Tax=Nocardioides panacisoli TaxID=627624 RepID=A0ABP7IGT5_9ACTN
MKPAASAEGVDVSRGIPMAAVPRATVTPRMRKRMRMSASLAGEGGMAAKLKGTREPLFVERLGVLKPSADAPCNSKRPMEGDRCTPGRQHLSSGPGSATVV